jgi:hypothetical protein
VGFGPKYASRFVQVFENNSGNIGSLGRLRRDSAGF